MHSGGAAAGAAPILTAVSQLYWVTTRLIDEAAVATLKGEPLIGEIAPLEAIANAAMSWLPWSVTYTAVVVAFTATAEGPMPPVANGDPFTWPSAPEAGVNHIG